MVKGFSENLSLPDSRNVTNITGLFSYAVRQLLPMHLQKSHPVLLALRLQGRTAV